LVDLRLSPSEADPEDDDADREQAERLREAIAKEGPPPSAIPASTKPPSLPPPSSKLSEQLARALDPSARTLAMLGTFLIGLGAVLYLARVVFIPLTFALMLSFLLSPTVTWFERRRVPRALGAALLVLSLLGVGGFAAVELANPAADWIARSPRVLQTLERKVRPWRRPVKNVSELAQRVERITQVDERKAPQEVSLEKPSMLSSALDTVWAVAAGALVTLFALYFTLLTGEVLLARVIAWIPDLNQRRTTEVIASIQLGMSRYLRTVFGINAAVGVLVALAMYVLGMPNPLLWGALAMLVNFVPYVGPFVGILTVGAVALASFDDTTRALLPPLVYLALASVEGNVITPLILGRTCELDPLVIFVWLLFWGWLWGIAGAVVAVPLLMLIKLMCERSQVLGPIAALISRGATPA
jgi:predicted PurR-regulated permease PerM